MPLNFCSFQFAAVLLIDLLFIPLDPPISFLFSMLPFSKANGRSKKALACPTGANLIPPVRPSEIGSHDYSTAAGSFVPAQHTLEDIPVVPVIPMLPKRRVVSMPVSLIEMGRINQSLSPRNDQRIDQRSDQAKIIVNAKTHDSDKVHDSEKMAHGPRDIIEAKNSNFQNSVLNRDYLRRNSLVSNGQRPSLQSRPPPAIDPNLIDIAGYGFGALAQREQRPDPPKKADKRILHSFRMLALGHAGKSSESKSEKHMAASPTLVVPPSPRPPPPPLKDVVISQPKSRASVKRTDFPKGPNLEAFEMEKEANMAYNYTRSDRPPPLVSESPVPPADLDRIGKMSNSSDLKPPPTNTIPESILQAYLGSLAHCSQHLFSDKVLEIFDTYMSLGSAESVNSEVSSAHSGALETPGETISTSSVYSDDIVSNLNDSGGLLHGDAKTSAAQSTATVSCTPVDHLLPHVPPVVPNSDNSTLVPLLNSFYFSGNRLYDSTPRIVLSPEPRLQHSRSPQRGAQPRYHPEHLVSESMYANLADCAYRMPWANLNAGPLQHLNDQVRLVQGNPFPQRGPSPYTPGDESVNHIRLPYQPPHTWQPERPSPPPPSPPPHALHSHHPIPNPVIESPLPSPPYSRDQTRRFQTDPVNSEQKHDSNPDADSLEIPEVIVLTPSQSRAGPVSLPLPNLPRHRVPGPINRHVSQDPYYSPQRRSLEKSLPSVHSRRAVSEYMGSSEPMGFCLDMGADYRASRFMIPKGETSKVENDYNPQNRQYSAAYMAYRNKNLPMSPSEDQKMNAKMNNSGNQPSMTNSERPQPGQSTMPVFQVRSFTTQKEDVAKDKRAKHRSLGLFKKLLH